MYLQGEIALFKWRHHGLHNSTIKESARLRRSLFILSEWLQVELT